MSVTEVLGDERRVQGRRSKNVVHGIERYVERKT